MAFKRNNSHGGYGLQKECEALISHVLNNIVKSKMPTLIPDVKNNQDSAKFREEGKCETVEDKLLILVLFLIWSKKEISSWNEVKFFILLYFICFFEQN